MPARRLPPFPALRAFEAAGRLQSFALAAQELHLTPSAVSHQVRQLEQHFERALFVRRPRGVELSAEGRQLLAGLTPALDQVESACAALQRAAGTTLALHCAPSFATQWLQPRLPRLFRDWPELALKLSSGAEPVDLRQRSDLDLWIAYGAVPARRGIVVRPLGDERIAPLCAPVLVQGTDPVACLARLTLIDSALSPVTWPQWFEINGLPLPAGRRPSFDRAALAIASAVDGVGVVLESTRLAERELARGALVVLGGDRFKPLVRPIHHLCHRATDSDPARIGRFCDWLQGALG
ncbi:MAG: LysR substrate-binding domain-containing protein [Rubrivivax sp.]|nr:LysR substrate-binding domain-containing protein [Rubrivivax sp.]